MVSFTMANNTQSNAVFRSSIVFHVIDVMNFFAVLFSTYRTSMVVAFSNLTFELLIKGWRIRLERFTASPRKGFFSLIDRMKAFARTKSFVEPNRTYIKFFITNFAPFQMSAKPIISKFPNSARRGTGLGTKFITRPWFCLKSFVTPFANSLLKWRCSARHILRFTTTNSRTIFLLWKLCCNVKNLFALRTLDFLNNSTHRCTIKGASRSASQYCCLVNTG